MREKLKRRKIEMGNNLCIGKLLHFREGKKQRHLRNPKPKPDNDLEFHGL